MRLTKILITGLLSIFSLSALAIPAKQGVRTYTQADGSTISLELIGDEFFHTLLTTDGVPVSLSTDGNYYYRTSDGVSNVIAHNADMRSASEASFISNNAEKLSIESLVKTAKKSGAMRSRSNGPARVGSTQVPNTGSPKVPILLVQYSDYKFKDSDPKATFESFFSSGSTSAYQYFVDQSNGNYTPEYDVYGPVTLSGTRATYGGNDSTGSDVGVGTMVGEACKLLDSSIDFSQYDNDNDGECDVIIVLYAGDGEASSYDSDAENSIWPCQWQLSSSDYGKYLTLDKTKVNKFAVFNELYGADLTKIDGIGTFCHEFSHCLGLPDFYDTNYSGYFGMGNWSLMDYGSYNNNGYTPLGYSAYEKEFMGWISLEEGAENTKYTLPVFNQKDAATDKAVKITNDKDANEYYILENRAQQGWDEYLPAEGMMITHVTYSASAWTGNTVNDYSPQRMTIIPADNELKMNKVTYSSSYYYQIDESSLLGDLWPYGSANELTDSSTPAAKVNTGTYMSKPITEITKNTDGTVSFWLMKAAAVAVATPSNLSAIVGGTDSATISWDAVTDTDVTYTLEVTKHRDAAETPLVETDFTTGSYGGWTKSNSGEINSTDGVKLASTSNPGTITSPEFTTGADGKVTVKLNAKYYGSDNSSLTVKLSTGASTTVSLSADYSDYTVVLAGTADTATTVSITAEKKKRAYIRNVTIYDGDKSANAPARVTETATTYTRTFSGITTNAYQVTGLEENTLYDYRVKAVPNDTEFFLESEWSEYSQFTTDEGEIVIRALAAPTNLSANVESTTSATISWEAGEAIESTYNVEVLKADDTTPLTFSGISETSKLVEGLDEEATYQFRVQAVPTDTERYSESEWSEYASFNLEDGIVVITIPAPENADANINSSTSATITWDTVNDYDVTYSAEVTEMVEAPAYKLVSTTDFSTASNYSSWTTGGYTNAENSILRLGSGNKTGSVTSPAFTTTDSGKVSVTFNAQYYNTDGSSIKVSLLSGSGYGTTDASQTVSLSNTYTDYTVVLSGSAKTSVKVQLETLVKSKRVNLKSVTLYTGDVSEGAETILVDGETSLIENIEDNYYVLDNLTKLGTYKYRVKAVPVDTRHYSESEWTDYSTFTLEDIYTAVESIANDVEADAEYYTLQGIRLHRAPTAHGIYIRRQGNKTTKVVL